MVYPCSCQCAPVPCPVLCPVLCEGVWLHKILFVFFKFFLRFREVPLPASCRSRCRTLSLLRMLLLGAAVAAFAPSSSSVPLGCALPASGGRAAVSICATATISRQAPLPTGPDPYKLVASDLEHIKASIKKVLSDNKGGSGAISKNEVLTMAAREFMQRKGKSFRPMVVLLVGRATHPDFSIGNRHYKLGVRETLPRNVRPPESESDPAPQPIGSAAQPADRRGAPRQA